MNRILPTIDSGIDICEKMLSCVSFGKSAEAIIEPLAEFMNAPTGIILRFQKNILGEYPIEEASHKLPRKLLNAYKEAFYDTDPIAQAAFSQTGEENAATKKYIVPLYGLVDQSKFLHSFYYNEFLREQGLGDVLAMFVQMDDMPGEVFCVALQRWNDLPRFGKEDFKAFHQLYPLLSTCMNNISLRETTHLMQASNTKGNVVGHNVGISIWDENFRLIQASPTALADLNFSEPDERTKWLEWFHSVAQSSPSDMNGIIYDGTFNGLHISIECSLVDGRSRYTIMSITPDFNDAITQWASRCQLTTREQEVCRYIISGLTNESTGYQMNISVKTVQNHIISIYTKLGVNSRSQLVARLMGWEMGNGRKAYLGSDLIKSTI